MAKKSMLGEAADAVKSVAGAAIGAAAVSATSVVIESVAQAMTEGGKKLGKAGPGLETAAADKVSKPILPTSKKRAASPRKTKVAKKAVAIRAAKAKRTSRRKKR